MPCVCGQRVDRGQPKVECGKCNEFFHLACVGVQPVDIEYLQKTNNLFKCKACMAARRNSIRSPPSSISVSYEVSNFAENNNFLVSKNGENTVTMNSAVSPSDSHNKCSKQLKQISNPSPNPIQCKPVSSQKQTPAKEITLLEVFNELVALRADHAHALSQISALQCDKSRLMQKIDTLTTDLDLMRCKINELDVAPAISSLANNVKELSNKIAVVCDKSAVNNECSDNHTPACRPINDSAAKQPKKKSIALTVASAVATDAHTSYAAVAADNHSPSVNAQTSQLDWINVKKRKKRKQPIVVGSNINSELSVAVRLKWLHLSSFSPSVSTDNIIDYVSNHAKIDKTLLSCYKLVKKEVNVESLKRVNFKLGISDSHYDKLLNPDIWPANVNVRPFQFFQKAENHQLTNG